MKFISNAGVSSTITESVLSNLRSNSRLSLVLDKERTLRIFEVEKKEYGLTVRCKDDSDNTLVVLTLPHKGGAKAQAQIIYT